MPRCIGSRGMKYGKLYEAGKSFAATCIAVLAAIYYGPRKMLETWDWYLNRFFDEPVLDVLRENSLLAKELRVRPVEGYSIGELAELLNRSQQSIGKSLRRLKRKGRVELYRGGFRTRE